ncbi:hypothetical protein F5Y15DRAFT_159358 [Xylariaceae sp. FL0016]|nr:hypothetical protein F5Y15DRAFT_159358 [Xylariaceae sp. FL0016]
MSRKLEPTLLSLLPTLTVLPQPLLELASSLLAQSRHTAGALKTEEEVARSFACCHIACDRLKIDLDLPPIQANPPIPPRIYKRLYTHLDNVLPRHSVAKSGRVRTPSSKLRESGLFGSAQRVPSRGTPSRDEALAKFRSPAARGDSTPTKSTSKPPAIPAKRKAGGVISAMPAWVRPTIQLMCKELEEERIGRTVLAGMQTIVAPHGQRTKDKWVNDHLTPLLSAVYFLVSSQVYVLEKGKELDNKQYAKTRKSILRTLEGAQENISVGGMDEDELWIGWTDVNSKDIDKAVAEVIGRDWQQGEWYTGIKHLVKADDAQEHDGDDVDMQDGEEGYSEKLHVQRADTMFQSRWEVTDEKRREYQAWEESVMRQIEQLEQAKGAEMEVEAAA